MPHESKPLRALAGLLWLTAPAVAYEVGRRDGERWGRLLGQLSATADMTRALAERERARSAVTSPPPRRAWFGKQAGDF